MKKSITGCFKAVSSWLESFHNILTLYLRTAKYIYLTYNMGLDILREYLQEYFIQEKGPERGRKERKEKRKEGRKPEWDPSLQRTWMLGLSLEAAWRGEGADWALLDIPAWGGGEKSILQDRAFQVSCKEDRLAAGAGLRVLKTSSVPSPYPLQVAGLGMALHCRTTLPASSQWDVSVGILFLLLQESSVGLLALD